MKHYVTITLLLFTAVGYGCRRSTSERLESLIEAASARARNKVDIFITELANPTGIAHMVQAPVEVDGNVRQLWLIDVSFKDGEFEGAINNDPRIVGNVNIGQRWTIKKADISDWMFMRDGMTHGHYTIHPLLKSMPKEEAAAIRSTLADP